MKKTLLTIFALGLSSTTLLLADPAKAPATPSNSGGGQRSAVTGAATAGETKAAAEGITFQNGVPYFIHDGQAYRIDAEGIPAGHMRTKDGQIVPMPAGISGLQGSQTGNVSTPTAPAKATTQNPATR